MFRNFFAFLGVAFLASAVSAAEPQKPTITDAFIYPSAAKVGMGFFTVTSAKNDAIIEVSSDCCASVEIHRNEKINGVMTMRKVSNLAVEKGKPLKVQPGEKGGLHVMLIGLKQPLVVGDVVEVNFTFEKAGAVTQSFTVKAREQSTSGDEHSAHSHEGHE